MPFFDRAGIARSVGVAGVVLFIVAGAALAGQFAASSDVRDGASPTATSTGAPAVTVPLEVASPTETPEATETPEPVRTPEATETPRPIGTPEATDTPEPTGDADAAGSPKQGEGLEPRDDEAGATIAKPTESPEATGTFRPDALGSGGGEGGISLDASPTPRGSFGGGDAGSKDGPDAGGSNGG